MGILESAQVVLAQALEAVLADHPRELLARVVKTVAGGTAGTKPTPLGKFGLHLRPGVAHSGGASVTRDPTV